MGGEKREWEDGTFPFAIVSSCFSKFRTIIIPEIRRHMAPTNVGSERSPYNKRGPTSESGTPSGKIKTNRVCSGLFFEFVGQRVSPAGQSA